MLSHDRSETIALGKKVGERLLSGDVVVLNGPMGAGKSEFSRGVARGMGISGAIPSPSFTICNSYDSGSIPLYHFDWYRISDAQELYDIGLDELIGGRGVALIEWASRAPECVPMCHLEVEIIPVDENTREIKLHRKGAFHALGLEEE